MICLTDLSLQEPNQYTTFYNNQVFNITIYFEDLNKNQPIDVATIWYQIDGGGWFSTSQNNGTAGYYNITVDCGDFNPNDYGNKTVEITANKTTYENQTLDYEFYVICLTDLILEEPNQ